MLVCFNLSLLTVFNFDIFLNCNCVLSDVYRQPVFIFSPQPSVCGNLTDSDFGHQYLDVVAVTNIILLYNYFFAKKQLFFI